MKVGLLFINRNIVDGCEGSFLFSYSQVKFGLRFH